MIKKQTIPKKFDQEEKELLSSFENDEWQSVKSLKKAKSSAHKIAIKTLRKNV